MQWVWRRLLRERHWRGGGWVFGLESTVWDDTLQKKEEGRQDAQGGAQKCFESLCPYSTVHHPSISFQSCRNSPLTRSTFQHCWLGHLSTSSPPCAVDRKKTEEEFLTMNNVTSFLHCTRLSQSDPEGDGWRPLCKYGTVVRGNEEWMALQYWYLAPDVSCPQITVACLGLLFRLLPGLPVNPSSVFNLTDSSRVRVVRHSRADPAAGS